MRMLRLSPIVLALCAAVVASAAPPAPPATAPKPAPPAQPVAPAAQPAPAAPAPAAAPELKVITTEPAHVVVLPMKGSYQQHPAAFEQLGGFLASKGLTPAGPPFAHYFSDPTSTPEADLAWEVGFPVAAAAKVDAPYEAREVPATLTAVREFDGPMEELGNAWPAFIGAVLSSGYQIAGPAAQVFKGDMGSMRVEMRIPVQK